MPAFLLFLLFFVGLASAQVKLTPLGDAPDWAELDKFQGTITREQFIDLLDQVYAPNSAAADFISVSPVAATIKTRKGRAPYVLNFAASEKDVKPAPGYWRPRHHLLKGSKPLAGVKIAIDPGHLGGKWAKMEERWFRIGNAEPVTEGDMTLRVAKLLVPRLKALGAEVALTRSGTDPLTNLRPSKLRKAAVASLRDKGSRITDFAVEKESERLFYRTAEIRRRAALVNRSIRPDLVLCLHFNAEGWGDPLRPTLVDQNHLHFLVTGAWSAKELEYEDQRFEMLVKLLNRSLPEEVAVTKSLAKSMAAATGLPPYIYTGDSAVRIGGSNYIWARNLLANRLFQCPVVYAEPYVMNSREVHARIQAGDYEGKKKVAGKLQPSIYREYADAIVAGLVDYYGNG